MKVSELWLRTFIETEWSFSKIAEKLTQAGIEVDALEMGESAATSSMTLKVPPNRGDCLSVEGIARELALLIKCPYRAITVPVVQPELAESIPIALLEPGLCPRYLGRVIRGFNHQTPTPTWIVERLVSAGLRAVSLIVDILNYVMLELGQPLHAFDLDKIEGGLQVRCAKAGEKIRLLDNQTLTLAAETLVIADHQEPHAMAGILGGWSSAVTHRTTALFIESAYFSPTPIRLSAKKYGIKTDSSYRYERGIDPNLQRRALERVTQLILESAGGKTGLIIEMKDETHLPKNPVVFLKFDKITTLLGSSLPKAEILDIFQRGQMTVDPKEGGCAVKAPSYRQDIALEVDLIEEIARIYGFHHFASQPPKITFASKFIPEAKLSLQEVKQSLLSRGYSEAITYSFIEPKLMQLFENQEAPLQLANPISMEMAAMRSSLIPGLVKALQYNQYRQQSRVRLFEMGLCFVTGENELLQKPMLGGIAAGTLYQEQWGVKKIPLDFYDVKQDVEALLDLITDKESITFKKVDNPMLHPGEAAEIVLNGKPMGYLGALHPRLIKHFELLGPLFVFEIPLTEAWKVKIPEFRALSKYPAIRRDLSLTMPKEVSASALKETILQVGGPLVQDVIIFDVYAGKGIEVGKKSLALSLLLQHPSRTLVDEEVNDIIKKVTITVSQEFQAMLRE
jgi:phenylalanyl-tRNA synthetase beta chain